MADRKTPARPRKTPTFRLHRPTGQAVVRNDGHDHDLGRHGSGASHPKYHRLIAESVTAGIPSTAEPGSSANLADMTMNEVVLAFGQHAERHDRDAHGSASREIDNFRDALCPLLKLCGHTMACRFGPLALRAGVPRWSSLGLRHTVATGIRKLWPGGGPSRPRTCPEQDD